MGEVTIMHGQSGHTVCPECVEALTGKGKLLGIYKILGQPYVKKSNQRTVMFHGRIRKVDTPRYKEWHESARLQLLGHRKPSEPISVPVNLRCHFYMKTHGRVDLSALYEGIQDVLVEMDILADDNYKIVSSHDGSRVFYDKENPRMEIEITEVKDE